MPIFKGLRVELQKRGAHLHSRPFEEYESSECVEKSSGLSSHRVLRLPTDVRFQILVSADATFQWEGANALRIQVDFDEGYEVKDAEIFVIRRAGLNAINAQTLTRTVNGDEYIQLSRIGRPIQPLKKQMDGGLIEIVDEELVSFRTVGTNSNQGRSANLHDTAIVRVAVYTCLLEERTGRHQAFYVLPSEEKPRRRNMSTKDPVAKASRIELFQREQQASVPRNFRSKKANQAGLFIFHYHAPDEFDRLKALDQEDHYIQDAGPGKRRVLPNSPEPDDICSPDEAVSPQDPDPGPIATPKQPPSILPNHSFGQDEDTIVVLTDDRDLDTMDVDEPESATSTDESIIDRETDADFMDIHTDLESIKNRNYTATDLEYLLDREEELNAQRDDNQSRINVECCEAFARIHKIREEEVRVEAEWSEKIESIDKEIKKVKANVARMTTRSVELEQELAEQLEQQRQTKAKCDELAKKARENAAATKLQLDHENRVLKKAEEKKQQRLSAVRARDTENA